MLLARLKSPLLWGGVGFGVGITSTSSRTMATNAPLAALAANADHSWVSAAFPIHPTPHSLELPSKIHTCTLGHRPLACQA